MVIYWMYYIISYRNKRTNLPETIFHYCPTNHGFPGSSESKESAYIVGDLGLISGLGRSPGEVNGYPLQDSFWRIPWIEKSGRLQSMGSQRIGHNWATFIFKTTNLTKKLVSRWFDLLHFLIGSPDIYLPSLTKCD